MLDYLLVFLPIHLNWLSTCAFAMHSGLQGSGRTTRAWELVNCHTGVIDGSAANHFLRCFWQSFHCHALIMSLAFRLICTPRGCLAHRCRLAPLLGHFSIPHSCIHELHADCFDSQADWL
jgi:hypothetical protein